MRFLLIRFSSLGDILLQTSFASWLKSQYPESHISFLTLNGHEALIKDHPHLDEILLYEKRKGLSDIKNLYRFCREVLAKRRFDLVLDLHGTNRSFLTRCFLPEFLALSMDKRRFERFLLVKAKIDLLKKEASLHERNLKDLSWAFNREYNKEDLLEFLSKYFPNNKSLITSSVTETDGKGPGERSKLVVLAPGASFVPKRWPAKSFLELARLILTNTDWACSVVAGPNDGFCEIFDELGGEFPGRFQNLQGKLGLGESMLYVSKASLVVGNDSLMGHVAESCSIPSFSVFGPTSESFGFAPHLKESKTFSVENLWCRPCSTTGSSACFRKEQYCMSGIAPEAVFQSVFSFIQRMEGDVHAL